MSQAPDALARATGGVALSRHAPVSLDGIAIAATLTPADADELATLLRSLGEVGLAVVPRGSGLHLAVGNRPRRADAFLSTARLSGIDAFEPAEGVCHVQSGTTLGPLRARVAEEGWELPLDAPDAASVGGTLAASVLGPRCAGFGPPRDAVLGLEVVLGSGERTRCGGRVVKNVTGYDLAKLYTGAHGTLGVITRAWLRLRPAPGVVRCLGAPADDALSGIATALDASRRSTARACALLGSLHEGFRWCVELAGDAAAVARDAAALRAEPLDPADALAPLAALAQPRTAPDEPGSLGVRVSALPSALGSAAAALAAGGARIAVHPALRLVWAHFPLPERETEAAARSALAKAEAAAREAEGMLRVELAPPALKTGRDVFGASAAERGLARALEQRFDPHGVLAPGRVAGDA